MDSGIDNWIGSWGRGLENDVVVLGRLSWILNGKDLRFGLLYLVLKLNLVYEILFGIDGLTLFRVNG